MVNWYEQRIKESKQIHYSEGKKITLFNLPYIFILNIFFIRGKTNNYQGTDIKLIDLIINTESGWENGENPYDTVVGTRAYVNM
jgi:hypothetical protein